VLKVGRCTEKRPVDSISVEICFWVAMLRHITGLGYLLQGWLVAESVGYEKSTTVIEKITRDSRLLLQVENQLKVCR